MTRLLAFADEAGNFDFSRKAGASRYFILTTVTLDEHSELPGDLQRLRYELAWEGIDHPGPFHATEDAQSIRDRVFRVLMRHPFRVDATIVDKSKAVPAIRQTDEFFYRFVWHSHIRHLGPKVAGSSTELMVVAASIGTKRRRTSFYQGVQAAVTAVSASQAIRTASWPANTEPGLQAADYCAWAIQRKWELGDARSYQIISGRIESEFDLFRLGTKQTY